MRRAAHLALALAAAAALAASAASPAAAEFGPIRLVSKSVLGQAREASEPAISTNGEYVAFEGVMEGGRQGVFEVDLASGVVRQVATGPTREVGATPEPAASAVAPSISADGRYVAFTTKAPLDPLVDPSASSEDVYVADMSTSPPTYELASIAPGAATAMGDAHAAARVALSANGREVAFVAEDQVYVRDLEAGETTLVSVERDPLTGEMEPGVPVAGGAVIPEAVLSGQNGAAISADGSTVAWLGTDVPEQVEMSAEEAGKIDGFDKSTRPWDEPLWRRIADGPSAPTRRVVGGGPLLPVVGNEPDKNAAQGWLGRIGLVGVPRLSADGRTVALIGTPSEAGNVYLADMSPGVGRAEGVRQLTAQVPVRPSEEAKVVNVEPYVPRNGHVWDVAITPDGKRVAFTTARQQFPLAPPNLVTPPPATLGLVELYEIDLEDESLRRVTHGYTSTSEPSLAPSATNNGLNAQAGSGAAAPSFAEEGMLIAFSSDASNLVEGDGNEASDAFVVEDVDAPRGSVNSIGTAPTTKAAKPRRRLVLSAFSLPDGRVRLVSVTPAKGSLRATAAAKLGVGQRDRTLAGARAKARKAGSPVSIVLALPRKLRRLAATREGVYGTAEVWFTPSSGGRLHASTPVRFHRRAGGGKGGS